MARILVIEDNRQNLESMAYLLSMHGHSITTAGAGERGLELARQECFDLIVCDLRLPDIDGCEIPRRLR